MYLDEVSATGPGVQCMAILALNAVTQEFGVATLAFTPGKAQLATSSVLDAGADAEAGTTDVKYVSKVTSVATKKWVSVDLLLDATNGTTSLSVDGDVLWSNAQMAVFPKNTPMAASLGLISDGPTTSQRVHFDDVLIATQ
jgi:hypothetical protein